MKPIFYLILAFVPVVLTGCGSGNNATSSPDEVKAFAPGMNNLSAEAQAAKEKNESQLRTLQATQAQKKTPR